MRLITYEGIEHLLTERDWKRLVRRFDARRAKLNTYGYYFIPSKSICYTRDYKCIHCPLSCPQKKTNSCTYLFGGIIGEDVAQLIHLRDSGILWEPKFDSDVRLALQKLTDFLCQAIKVKG